MDATVTYDIIGSLHAVKSISLSVSFASSERAKMWLVKPSSGPSSAPVPSPSYHGILYISIARCKLKISFCI